MRRAAKDGDGELNSRVIDACVLIAHKLPGGTFDAVRELRRLYDAVTDHFDDPHYRDDLRGSWLIERIAAIGSWALANRADTILDRWRGRSDMGLQVAKQLSSLSTTKLAHPLHELLMRQHHQDIPRELREEFIGISQRITGDLLDLPIYLDVPGLDETK